MIGEIVGEYRIAALLGYGGTGEQFLAEHVQTGAKARVEIVDAQIMASRVEVERYLSDVRTVAGIKHGGVRKVLDAGIDPGGRGYVVTEHLDGADTLAQRIESSGRLSSTQIAEIGRQLANVLAVAHDENLVHGDLRPSVIWLMKQGGLARGEPVKLDELGVAALKRSLGIVIGPVYAAPELLGSGASVDWRVDAYGLGCVAFEMATGRPPFLGASAEEVRAKHLEQLPPAPRSLMPDVSPALDVLIGRLLSKRPEDRFSSMREVGRVFESLGTKARPLAPTENNPIVVLGEVQASPAPARGESRVEDVRPEATAVVGPARGSRWPLAIVLGLLVAGAAVAAVVLAR
ncbi:MAG TPA: serine/threonine-protein kinase [Kofleriaceae bacterium]|nr:serine/threonine-protein kinase [Kofleriaceae bacterium]